LRRTTRAQSDRETHLILCLFTSVVASDEVIAQRQNKWRLYVMANVLPSLALLACVVVALIVARGRNLVTHIAVEAGLLLAITSFLLFRGSSPLPSLYGTPIGLESAWPRALAVIWWLIGARLVVNITVLARGHDPQSLNTRLFSDLAAAVIYITTILVILNSVLDLNVKGLLVTSGVIAIVMGLALQNTLADVFSGIAVGLERPFRVGDLVSVGDSVEGIIVQINWRSLQIQTDGADLATVPNSIVAKATIINRSVPTRRRAAEVSIVVSAHTPSRTVIELMRQAILLSPSAMSDPTPSITILRSGLRTAAYAASFFVSNSPDLAGARSAVLLQARRLFRHAGIGYAEPVTTTELLASLGPFQSLSEVDIEALATALVVHMVEAGDTIFEQGATATSLYVVQSGVMETSRSTTQTPNNTRRRIGPGEAIGELGLIAGVPRACTMRALTRGRLLELPGDALAGMRRANTEFDAALQRSAQHDRDTIDQEDAPLLNCRPEPSTSFLARARAFLDF
jgi:small-conductance mechanosensitive channel